MGSSNMEKEKAMELFKLITEFWKVISKMMRLMDQESLSGKMVKFMRDNLENQCLTVKER